MVRLFNGTPSYHCNICTKRQISITLPLPDNETARDVSSRLAKPIGHCQDRAPLLKHIGHFCKEIHTSLVSQCIAIPWKLRYSNECECAGASTAPTELEIVREKGALL